MTDPLWIRSILGVHIAAGMTAFVMAPFALATAKGGKAHRRWGKIYFWSMAVVGSTALFLSLYRPLLFLALVAIFSFYAAFSGYRVLFHKNLIRGEKVTWPDWTAAILTFACSFALALLGALRPHLVQNLGIPAILFGVIGMWLGAKSVWKFLHPPKEKMFWWYDHLGSMLGSYIAAWTAFSVTTIGRFVHGGWVLWVVPALIGIPAIALTNAYYRKKFTPRNKMRAA
ncbi:MAG: DUF2306 domain-containing protein [Acidobacteriaceae bacterium]